MRCLLALVALELVACRHDEPDAPPIPIPSAAPAASVAPEKPIGVRCYRDADCAADESCEIIAAGPDMGIRNCTKRAAAPPATARATSTAAPDPAQGPYAHKCTTFRDCAAGFYCKERVLCAPRLGEGEVCKSGNSVECREGLRCVVDLVLANRCRR